jgi:hypothetical protein
LNSNSKPLYMYSISAEEEHEVIEWQKKIGLNIIWKSAVTITLRQKN